MEYSYPLFPVQHVVLTLYQKLQTFFFWIFLVRWTLIKELVWYIQSLLRIDPGWTYHKKYNGNVLQKGLEAIRHEHAFHQIEENMYHPTDSAPSGVVKILKRERKEQKLLSPYGKLFPTENQMDCINFVSYNYVGLGQTNDTTTPLVLEELRSKGLSTGSNRSNPEGTSNYLSLLELEVAEFLGKEDSFCTGMGFGTNSTLISALLDKNGVGDGILVISDELNHRSMVEGIRLSGAHVKKTKHNDMLDLERALKYACDKGQSNGEPWRKVIIFIEGIYSMEGDFCRLREIVGLKRKYGALLYMDEAHSICSTGANGRGACEHFNVPFEYVDVLMGSLSKGFGSVGGYIAANKEIINSIREHSAGALFGTGMSPAAAAKAYFSLKSIRDNEEGQKKFKVLRENSNYFRNELCRLGFHVLGDEDSPVIPVMASDPFTLSKLCLDSGIAIIPVFFPAVPLLEPRIRFCMSANLSKEQLDYTIEKLDKFGDDLGIKYRLKNKCKIDRDYADYVRSVSMDLTPYSYAPRFESFSSSKENQFSPVSVFNRSSESTPSFTIQDPLGHTQCPLPQIYPYLKQHLVDNGFGMCGPRAFLGTSKEHLKLEESIAQFFGKEDGVYFSSGVATVSSITTALLVEDSIAFFPSNAHYGFKAGIRLNSLGTIKFYDNLDELEQLITYQSGKKLYSCNFVFAEGMSQNNGEIVDLPKLIQLKEKHKLILVLEETNALGFIGARGSIDYWNKKIKNPLLKYSISDIDIIMGSLEQAIGSLGGYCAGPLKLTESLRYKASGYLFTNAAPALAAISARMVMDHIKNRNFKDDRTESLEQNIDFLHDSLNKCQQIFRLFDAQGEANMVYLRLKSDINQNLIWELQNELPIQCIKTDQDFEAPSTQEESIWFFKKIQSKMSNQIEVFRVPSVEYALNKRLGLKFLAKPALRITISSLHSKAQIKSYLGRLDKICGEVLKTPQKKIIDKCIFSMTSRPQRQISRG